MTSDAGSQIDVLIVEDHLVLAEALAAALEERGFGEVRTAATVAEALDTSRARCADVVLMDFRLPDGDGTKAAAEIRADCPEAKIVMLTAEVHESVVLAAVEAGCSGYLLKNAQLEEVVAAVRSAHAGEALISPSMLARILPQLKTGRGGLGSQLSSRELQVLRLLSEGRSNQAIAGELVLSPNTVRNHIQRILTKLGAHSKLEAVTTAARSGILRFPPSA